MNEQRNSHIALLAVMMLLSGALLGLVISDETSADTPLVVGFVNAEGVTVDIIETSSGTHKTQTTVEDGSFSFSNLDSGNYMVRYSKVGYLSNLTSWDIPADLPLPSELVVLTEVASGDTNISGNITNSDDEGIEGAFVYLMNNSLQEDSWWSNVTVGYTLSAVTDSNGSYSFTDVSSGNYAVRVQVDGYYTKYIEDNSEWNITLDAYSDDNKQTIRVYDDEGNPLGDASVFMYDLDTSTWVQSAKYGGFSYLLKPATGSTAYIYAYLDNHAPAVKKLELISGSDTFDMTLDQNTASSEEIVYISLAPSKGTQSAVPLMGTKLIKLNPGPTALISSSHTDNDGTYVIGVDEIFNLSASTSTSPVGVVNYDWNTGSQTTANYSNTFVAGTYPVTLTVFDSFGDSNQATVTVIADGIKPVASFTSLSKALPSDNGTAVNATNVEEDYTTVVFNATSSTDEHSSVATYDWTFGDGTSNTGNVTNHIFDNPGTFTVVLNVTDEAGNYNSTSQDIIVQDLTVPSADFNWSYELDGETFKNAAIESVPTKFNAGLSSDNSCSPSCSEDDLTYDWDFGDGNISTGKEVTHTFSETNDEGFNVLLTVTDKAGNSDIIPYTIMPSLKERPDLFVSSLSFSNDNPEEGDSVALTATLKLLGMNVTDSFEVGFYLGADASNPIGFQIVEGVNMTVGIENEFNVTVTWDAVPGVHTIYVIADSKEQIDESSEKNEMTKTITVSAEDDSRDVTSIMLIVAVVVLSFGAVGYIYRERLFNK